MRNTILYVEDDPIIRDITLAILTPHFPEIVVASNGDEAWELYLRHTPSLVITDLKMPKMGGIELVEKIRENDLKTPVMVTSAHSEKEDLLSSIHLKVDRYLIKPIRSEELVKWVKAALEGSSAAGKRITITPECSFDLQEKIAYRGTEPIKLTRIENGILALLVANRNRIVNYEQFEHEIWPGEGMTRYALRTHMRQVRKKVGEELQIENFSGQGYRISLPEGA